MRKYIIRFLVISLMIIIGLSGNCYASSLENFNVQLDKTLVRPGENIIININFGENLDEYTLNIAYDNEIFEYVSAEGGEVISLENIIELKFEKGISDYSRNTAKLTFKAKEELTTSNPTNFAITAEKLRKANESIYFNNITGVSKELLVEPEYENYDLSLDYESESIIENEPVDMQISVTSNIGRYYEKAKLEVELLPNNESSKMIAIDENQVEYDLFKTEWKKDGYLLGGKNVLQILNVRTIFSESGEYIVKLNLIDSENNNIIATKDFNIAVNENINNPITSNIKSKTIEENIDNNTPTQNISSNVAENTTTTFLKTGGNIYGLILLIIVFATIILLYLNKKFHN